MCQGLHPTKTMIDIKFCLFANSLTWISPWRTQTRWLQVLSPLPSSIIEANSSVKPRFWLGIGQRDQGHEHHAHPWLTAWFPTPTYFLISNPVSWPLTLTSNFQAKSKFWFIQTLISLCFKNRPHKFLLSMLRNWKSLCLSANKSEKLKKPITLTHGYGSERSARRKITLSTIQQQSQGQSFATYTAWILEISMCQWNV